jgi:hypothetical protein
MFACVSFPPNSKTLCKLLEVSEEATPTSSALQFLIIIYINTRAVLACCVEDTLTLLKQGSDILVVIDVGKICNRQSFQSHLFSVVALWRNFGTLTFVRSLLFMFQHSFVYCTEELQCFNAFSYTLYDTLNKVLSVPEAIL